MRSFYEILGVRRDATQDEIRAAFREKAKSTHPDMGGDALSFANIKKGYDILSDPKLRASYDLWVNVTEARENQHLLLRQEEVDIFNRISSLLKVTVLLHTASDLELYQIIIALIVRNRRFYAGLDKLSDDELAVSTILLRATDALIYEGKYHPMQHVKSLNTYCKLLLNQIHKDQSLRWNNVQNVKQTTTQKSDDSPFIKPDQWYVIPAIIIVFLAFSLVLIGVVTSKDISKNGAKRALDRDAEVTNTQLRDTSVTDTNSDPLIAYESGSDTRNGTNDVNYNPEEISGVRNSRQQPRSEENTYIVSNFKNGDKPYRSYWGEGWYDKESLSQLTIINHSKNDAVVILQDVDDKIVRHAYVNKSSEYTMRYIPSCICIIRTMLGNKWNAEKDNGPQNPKGGFMRNTRFSVSNWSDSFSFIPEYVNDGINYPTYSITLHAVTNGNFSTQKISANEFFKSE